MGWCRGVDTSLCRLSKTYLESAVILFKNSVSLCCVVLAKMSPSTASFWRRRRRRRIWFISCWKTKCCPLESFKAQSLCQEGEEDPIMGKNDGIRLISTPCIAKKPTRDITETVMSSMNRIQLSDLLCCSVSSRDVLVVRLEKLPTMADFDQEHACARGPAILGPEGCQEGPTRPNGIAAAASTWKSPSAYVGRTLGIHR